MSRTLSAYPPRMPGPYTYTDTLHCRWGHTWETTVTEDLGTREAEREECPQCGAPSSDQPADDWPELDAARKAIEGMAAFAKAVHRDFLQVAWEPEDGDRTALLVKLDRIRRDSNLTASCLTDAACKLGILAGRYAAQYGLDVTPSAPGGDEAREGGDTVTPAGQPASRAAVGATAEP